MALDEQELRCIEFACRYLDGSYPGPREWKIEDGPSLEDQHPGQPCPEAVVTNGSQRAAIEVKQLMGAKNEQDWTWSLKSLRQRLCPSVGGSYSLDPWADLRLPMEPRLITEIGRQIEEIAPGMGVGDSRPIRVRCEGTVRFEGDYPRAEVYCSHLDELVSECSARVSPGIYWLEDDTEPKHLFLTEEGKEDFRRRLVKACEQSRSTGECAFEWFEEWRLRKEGLEPKGVLVLAMESGFVISSAAQDVDVRIQAALPKFSERRWQVDFHVLALDHKAFLYPASAVQDVFAEYSKEDIPGIDLILLVNGYETSQVWPPAKGSLHTDQGESHG